MSYYSLRLSQYESVNTSVPCPSEWTVMHHILKERVKRKSRVQKMQISIAFFNSKKKVSQSHLSKKEKRNNSNNVSQSHLPNV